MRHNEDQQATLDQFLQTGKLGQLNYSNSLKEIYHLLGEPASTFYPPGKGNENLVVLYYNNLEITFLNEMMVIVGITFKEDYGGLPPKLNEPWYDKVREMNFITFTAYLRRKNIQYQCVTSHLLTPNSLIYIDEGKIEVAFDEENEYKIEKILSSNLGPRNWQLEDC